MVTPTTDVLRIDLRLRRYPYPALLEYLLTVPGAQRPGVVRHLLYLGWLVQSGTLAPASQVPSADGPRQDSPGRDNAPPDPLELELLHSLGD